MVEFEAFFPGRLGRVLAPALLSVLLAAGGIALAVPRLAVEIGSVGFEQSHERRVALPEFRFWAVPDIESARALRLMREASTGAERHTDLLAEARGHLRRALSGSPARPWDWTRLAWLGEMGVASWPEASGAFRMAVLTERFSPELTPVLVSTGLRLWPVLDAAQRDALRDLTHRQWQWGPGRLAGIAYELYAKPQVEELLADQPAALADFRSRFEAVSAARSK